MKKKEYRSILDKYSLYLFTIGVGLVLILIAFTTSISIKRYEETLMTQQTVTLDSSQIEFSSHLNTIESSVDSISLTMSNLIADQELIESDMEFYNEFIENIFIGYLQNNQRISRSMYLYFNPELTGEAHDIWLTIDQENNIIQEDEIPLSRYISKDNMDWFYGPKESKVGSWVEPYYNRYDEYITSYVAPIYYGDRFIGVIGMYLDLDLIQKLSEERQFDKNEFFWMTDENNRVIYHPNYNKGDLVYVQDESNISKGILQSTTLENGWIFVYQNEVNAISNQKVEQAVIVFSSVIVIFGLFFLLTYHYRKGYQKRTEDVIKSIQELSNGDYSSRINVLYNDEIGIMAKAFNEATDHIESLLNDLKEVAYYHPVTLLPNINKLISDFEELIKADKTKNISICYVKFGKLSTVNDLISYQAGNDYLIEITNKLSLLEDDSISLYHSHGDSFVILSLSKDKECSLRNDIIQLFNHNLVIEGTEFDLRIRIGTSIYPEHSSIPNEVIRNAEIAVNQCNNNTPFMMYEPKIFDRMLTDNNLIVEFRKAVKMREFVMHYQPIINTETSKIDYLEALVRWNHPTKGLIYPNDFIGYAEETGLIVKLSELIIEEVCIQMRDWNYKEIYYNVAINISSKDILETDFVSKICNIVTEYKIDPSFLHFEITERSRITENIQSIQKLVALKQFGFSIVLDDFGTGYSSFSYIQKLPLSTVKLDRVLLENINLKKNASLIESIILMNNKLNLITIIEGVETKAHYDFCKKLKVKYLQGYYFSKAIPTKDVSTFIIKFNKEE